MSDQPKRYLEIPFGVEAATPSAYIPLGISEEDFDLLLKTLELWKPNIVTKDEQHEILDALEKEAARLSEKEQIQCPPNP